MSQNAEGDSKSLANLPELEKSKSSAYCFEREMLGTMSIGYSTTFDDAMDTLHENWGPSVVEGERGYQRYPTQSSVLGYARQAHKIASKFLAEQEECAMPVGEKATGEADSKKRARVCSENAEDTAPKKPKHTK